VDAERLASLLDAVARGDISPTEAGELISRLPVSDLDFARIDSNRLIL
jgi:hypothetical protein